ncbi:alpha-ketoglutarate-dependent dioxygenase AlkB [Paralimibaculum aggregatum]|uniref:Alpha-ketoglutarate-dependent dioxygenase AlkB n=1 Tax=Paralimibaculum aggregatum TaxID=3036245 RepID=A0ABQ6LRA9_9RHOB|nr:alpha-ketoglutarate-dependent dioxygenase AlkB [Limibaculum sp. NKW23]GMG84907.1 alpha-ketoglutarate-dependent dioxygenase AlkB [Limibaculum sp. NKW23]
MSDPKLIPDPPAGKEELAPGAILRRGFLDRAAQAAMADALRDVAAEAPLLRPVTAWGRPMSVRMTAAGRLGWVIERGRYAYSPRHPETGRRWPPIPEPVLAVWRAVSGWPEPPDCCLVNWYGEGARMGLHRDADEGEAAFAAPVVSISLGDPARFRIGGTERRGPTRSTILRSGDVLAMGGASRLAYHGVDRILFGEGDLLPGGGRLNLTLRVVRA